MTQVPRTPFKGLPRITRDWWHGGDAGGSTYVRFYANAGKHEDHFRTYWLVGAWIMLTYQSIAMLILILHMAFDLVGYPWLAHAIGTTVISLAYVAMACIYRFILFPHPGYLASGHPAAELPDIAAKHPEGASV